MLSTPRWLTKRLKINQGLFETRRVLAETSSQTVCLSAMCPNTGDCFSKKFCTFLILGNVCTRSCGFCAVRKGSPRPLDASEPDRILEAARRLDLRYAVITSVTRDDLEDGGASQFVEVSKRLRSFSSGIKIELLVPDFLGRDESAQEIVGGKPDVVGHNIETVKRLYPTARAGGDYYRSLHLLRLFKDASPSQVTKSGLMVGLGEREEEVLEAMEDLRQAGCDILTIGQYLRPAKENLPVARFVEPKEFERYKEAGLAFGFRQVSSGPFVRSSYCAEEAYRDMEDI